MLSNRAYLTWLSGARQQKIRHGAGLGSDERTKSGLRDFRMNERPDSALSVIPVFGGMTTWDKLFKESPQKAS